MEYRNRNASQGRSPDLIRRLILLIPLALLTATSIAQEDERVCTAAEREFYMRAIRDKFHENWRVPYDDRTITCLVLIKQNFRGEVLDVGIAKCGDDLRVQKSVIDAAYRASPIPLPENKACFNRDIILDVESRTVRVESR